MSGKDINTIKENLVETDNLLKWIRGNLDEYIKESTNCCVSEVRKENIILRKKVEELKQIIQKKESVKLNPLPRENMISPSEELETHNETAEKPKKTKDKKESKVAVKAAKADSSANESVDVGRLDFRIGRIVSVEKHPDADSLYIEKIDVGESNPRTVVSGLVKHMPASDLENRIVVLLCNLKPAKMRGVTSEAMVMCASTPEKVEVLIPPEGSVPGDIVEFEGYERRPDSVLNPKKKIFETCAPDLKTDQNCIATYKEVPFVVPGKGKIVAKNLSNVQIK